MDIEKFWQLVDSQRFAKRRLRCMTPDGKRHTMWLRYLKPPKEPKLAVRLAMAAAQPPSTDNLRCQRCGLCQQDDDKRFLPDPVLVTPAWEPTGKVLVVLGEPLGDELALSYLKHEILKPAGLNATNVDFLYAVKCQPTPDGNRGKHGTVSQMRMCRPFVLSDIFERRPAKVITFGEQAAFAVSEDNESSIMDRTSRVYRLSYGYWSVPYLVTYSPEACISGGSIGRGFAQLVKKHVDWFVNDKMKSIDFPELEVHTRWKL